MIFVTVGTDHHPFDRLFDWLHGAIEAGAVPADEPIVVQYGHTEKGRHPRFEASQFMPFDEMMANFERADLVITHASSTALLVCHHGKMPLVVPRMGSLGEHIDDHQLDFVNDSRDALPLKVALSREEFDAALATRDEDAGEQGAIVVGGAKAVERFKRLFEERILRRDD